MRARLICNGVLVSRATAGILGVVTGRAVEGPVFYEGGRDKERKRERQDVYRNKTGSWLSVS